MQFLLNGKIVDAVILVDSEGVPYEVGGGANAATSDRQDVQTAKLEAIRLLLSSIGGNTDQVETLQEAINTSVTTLQTYVDSVEALLTTLGGNTDQVEALLNTLGVQTDQVEPLLGDIKTAIGTLAKLTDTQPVSAAALVDGTQITKIGAGTAKIGQVAIDQTTDGATNLVSAKQGVAAPLDKAWPTKITDGVNQMPTMDDPSRAGYQKIVSSQRSSTLLRATADGSVSAGAYSISFTAISGTITVAGAALNVGESVSFDAPLGDTLGAIAYTVTGGELVIAKVS